MAQIVFDRSGDSHPNGPGSDVYEALVDVRRQLADLYWAQIYVTRAEALAVLDRAIAERKPRE